MMKRIMIVCVLVVGLGSPASAQTFDLISDQLYEPLIGAPALSGARALSLGGAVTAAVQDGSALWFNPAALARIPRIEVSGDFVQNRVLGQSMPLSLEPLEPPPQVTSSDASLRQTQFGSAYLTVPVPTYRGALTLAAGVTVSNRLDRVLSARLLFDPGTFVDVLDEILVQRDSTIFVYDTSANPDTVIGSFDTTFVYDSLLAEEIGSYNSDDDQRGTVRAWQVGFGVDVSPRLSLGVAAAYYSGTLEFSNHLEFQATRYQTINRDSIAAVPVQWNFVTSNSESISGWGAHGGVLFRPRNDLALGLVVRTPVKFTIDLDQFSSEQRDLGSVAEFEDFTTRRLQIPFSLNAGGAWLYRQMLFALDLGYTDWSQTEYKDSPVLSQYNDALNRTYREAISVGGGVEWIIPRASTTLRAGARWAKLPFDEQWIADERITLSAGAGFLIDQTMAFDFALAHETWRGGNPVFGFDERYGATRVVVTAAYRI